MSRYMICRSVFATLLGLLAAFQAYRYVLSIWDRMKPVLTTTRTAAAPGLFDSIG